MNPENNNYNQPVPNIPQTPQQLGKKKKPIVKVLLIIVILSLLFGVGVYLFVKNNSNEQQSGVNEETSSQENSNQNASDQSNQTIENTYSQDTTIGYPLSLPGKALKATIVLPSEYSVITSDYSAQSQAELNSNYVTTFNDIVANWLFNKRGTKENPTSGGGGSSMMISAMSEWLKQSDAADSYYFKEPADTEGPYSLAKKATFVKDLKSKTAECVKDPTKGFKTDDGVLNICYDTPNPQAADSDYALVLRGYGEINGTPLYLRSSYIMINSAKDKNGAIQKNIDALKKITITLVDNPNYQPQQ